MTNWNTVFLLAQHFSQSSKFLKAILKFNYTYYKYTESVEFTIFKSLMFARIFENFLTIVQFHLETRDIHCVLNGSNNFFSPLLLKVGLQLMIDDFI